LNQSWESQIALTLNCTDRLITQDGTQSLISNQSQWLDLKAAMISRDLFHSKLNKKH